MSQKISASVDGGTSGTASVRRRGARTPIINLKYKTQFYSTLRCPTLHDIYQITPKYVIPIYEKLGFPNFWSFPASFSVFAACAKNTKDFQNLYSVSTPHN
jgi:hypothetical protein